MILVTGSAGLIGRHLIDLLRADGHAVRTFDCLCDPRQDTRDAAALEAAMDGVDGIVHLAAISRVVWAQNDPDLTQSVNVEALEGLVSIASAAPLMPWIIFASSREVYGEPQSLPVRETAALAPLNVYARSKVEGEKLIDRARAAGLVANIARFSNVYGCVEDHHDRVVPAFARAAANGEVVFVEGADNMFDFTHVRDASQGLARLVERTARGDSFPPIHFVTGDGTTLRELAQLAVEVSDGSVEIAVRAPRNYDVARFVGDPSRAHKLLDWRAQIGIEQGFRELADGFRASDSEIAQFRSTGTDRMAVRRP